MHAFWDTRLSIQIVESGESPKPCVFNTVKDLVIKWDDYSDEEILNDRPKF